MLTNIRYYSFFLGFLLELKLGRHFKGIMLRNIFFYILFNEH